MGIYSTIENVNIPFKVFSSLTARPSAVGFGVGACLVGSEIYFSDGTTWNTAGTRVYTWATLPAAATFDVGLAFVSDIGIAGTMFYSDATTWRSVGPIVLAESASPGYLVPSMPTADAATYSQTLKVITVTGTHVVPDVTHNGKSVYLKLTGGTAVSGWFTGFTYVSSSSFTCTSTVSQTDSGTVQTNIAETTITPISVTVPGNLMGVNGIIKVSMDFIMLSSGNLKTVTGYFDSQAFATPTATTSVYMGIHGKPIRNKGVANKQYTTGLTWLGGGASASAPVSLTVDTTLDKALTFSVTLAAASEFIALSGYDITLLRA